MSEPSEQDDTCIDEELIAYLDGELNADAARRFEARLAEDEPLRRKLKAHQRTWDLLGELPRTEVGNRFTHKTVEVVAVSTADLVTQTSRRDAFRAKLRWLVGGGTAAAALFGGYALVASIVAAPNRQLVEDLRVIEHLDEYRVVEDIEFLRALDREGLFAAEVDDAL